MNFCSAGAHERTAGKPADANFVLKPDGSEHCLRKQAAAGSARVKPDPIASVDLPLLRRIASAELRFYLDGLACRHLEDAERAIVFRLQELGIDRTAYEAAQEAMGWQAALLAVAIIDRNRDHPVTPIRNPGGALRALTRRHQQGGLNLMASVWGILGRGAE